VVIFSFIFHTQTHSFFHNFTAEEEEQGVEHVKFEVWTEPKENNKSEGKFIFFRLAKISKMVNLGLVKVY
jgi:hypothetical protein